ncbi:MAG: hypothetical protein KF764_32445 [Labilithrix sp.]|nr:hypothetical protein [Labilithrix sp.]
MNRFARFAAAAILAAVIMDAAPSRADPPPASARERVTVTSSREAALEERRAGESVWSVVCRAPCSASVLAEPAAEHRVFVKGDRAPTPVHVAAGGGEIVVDVPEDDRSVAIAVAGVSLAVLGNGTLFAALGAMARDRSPAEPDARMFSMVGVGLLAGAFGVVLAIRALRSPGPPRVTVASATSADAAVAPKSVPTSTFVPRSEATSAAVVASPRGAGLVVPLVSLSF